MAGWRAWAAGPWKSGPEALLALLCTAEHPAHAGKASGSVNVVIRSCTALRRLLTTVFFAHWGVSQAASMLSTECAQPERSLTTLSWLKSRMAGAKPQRFGAFRLQFQAALEGKHQQHPSMLWPDTLLPLANLLDVTSEQTVSAVALL